MVKMANTAPLNSRLTADEVRRIGEELRRASQRIHNFQEVLLMPDGEQVEVTHAIQSCIGPEVSFTMYYPPEEEKR